MKTRVFCCVLAGLISFESRAWATAVYGLDLDHNGLSDVYELMHPGVTNPLADNDSDGQTNAEEAAAATDPLDGTSVLSFDSLTQQDGVLTVRWQGVVGKRYQIQSSADIAGGWANEGAAVMGVDGEMSRQFPADADRMFLRLTVSDTDSDGDGVTDWEEGQAGTNPMDGDSDHDGINGDLELLARLMTGGSVVSVVSGDAVLSEVGSNPGTFTIVRSGSLKPLTVLFSLGGTATAGTDYTAGPMASVFFPLGATKAEVTITPVSDAIADPNETVLLNLTGAADYILGDMSSAALVIEDSSSPSGTGLLGRYYNLANTTYTSTENFNPLDLKFERIDSAIDFNWGTATPDPRLTNIDLFSVRWTGQVLPAYTETYTFYFQADRGGKVWVNGQLLVDQWNGTASQEYNGTIDLVAGQRYDVKVDYRESSSTPLAMVKFSWSSPSQSKQVVPANRMYAFGQSPPVITSLGSAVGLVGGPFSFDVTATNAPTAFMADGLPPGLSLDWTTGQVTGTPTQEGTFFVTLTASNTAGSGAEVVPFVMLGTGGGLTHDTWIGVNGASLLSLPLSTPPTTSATLAEFSVPADEGDNFGDRVRGWLTAPASGNYTFFLTTADENAELWVSASDDPARSLRRSLITNAAPGGAWNGQATQKSLPMKLQAGQRYYIEARRKETTGADQLAVGWIRPGQPDASMPAEIIPGYCLSPFVTSAPTTGQSALYITTLTPQSSAQSLGAGSATMTVNEEQTEATIYVQWANLTGPKTQMHVHDASRGGAIIFDFDTEEPDVYGAYHWTLAPTGGISVADIRAAIAAGTTYVNVHTAQYPAGEIKGFLTPATGSQDFVPPAAPPSLAAGPISETEAIRFLNQATYGVSGIDANNDQQLDSVVDVQNLGYEAWITKQMDPAQTPATLLRPQVTQFYLNFPRPSDGGNAESSNEIWRFWWKSAITAPDQLRQRVAFALSQILVVSENGVLDENATALTAYYDLLAENAFGNFRTLLEDVTLSYAMGKYLDMAGNKKPNPSIGRTANENYAREIMQLFSIGLKRLHPDGTLVLGRTGLPVETYNQDVIVGMANNFTGWAGDPTTEEPIYRYRYTLPMTLRPTDHYTGEKPLLDNTVLPARNDGTRDLVDSHDVLFQHPNVGPFICRQLIQRLVTANPSPGYIYRVARQFEDDGTGVRGNLGAVVKAILLDYEARAQAPVQQPGYGHLREPVLRTTQVLRALNGVSKSQGQPMSVTNGTSQYALNPAYDEAARSQSVPHYIPSPNLPLSPGWDVGTISAFSQTPLRSPTVFNFFEPDYVFSGMTGSSGLVGPEFQITAETTVANFANWFYDLPRNGQGATTNWDSEAYETTALAVPPTSLDIGGIIYKYNTTTVDGVKYPETPRPDTEGRDLQIDLTVEKSLAYDEDALLNRLNRLLLGNTMSSELRTLLRNYLAGMPKRVGGTNEPNDRLARAADAIYVIVVSPEFAVQK